MINFFRKALGSGTINTWVALAIRVGGLALLLPIVLLHLDLHQVLVWQLQSSIIATVAWVDFGITPTFSRFVASARGGGRMKDLMPRHDDGQADDDDRVQLADVIRVSGRIYVVMGLLGTLIGLAVGTAVLAGPISGLDDPTEGWISWSITLLVIPFSLVGGRNAAVLIGADHITPLRRIESVVGLAQIATTSAVVLLTSNLAWIAVSYSFWSGVLFVACWWQQRRVLAGLNAASTAEVPGRPDDRVFRAVWMAAWRSGIGVLFSGGLIQGSGLIMPQISSPEVATQYLILLRVITIVSQLSQAPFYSKLPAMAKANAEGDKTLMITLATRGMQLALWTMVAGIAAMAILLPLALKLIGSSVQIANVDLALLLGAAFFAERYGGMHMQIYTLSGKVIWHLINGATGVTIVLLFVLLWPFAGPASVPLAMLIGYLGFLCPVVSTLSLRYMNEGRWAFEARTSLRPAIAFVLCSSLVFAVDFSEFFL